MQVFVTHDDGACRTQARMSMPSLLVLARRADDKITSPGGHRTRRIVLLPSTTQSEPATFPRTVIPSHSPPWNPDNSVRVGENTRQREEHAGGITSGHG
eukprot:957679-Rhodomonas_salina.4